MQSMPIYAQIWLTRYLLDEILIGAIAPLVSHLVQLRSTGYSEVIPDGLVDGIEV